MPTAKLRLQQFVAATANQRAIAAWLHDVSIILTDDTKGVQCWIKRNARVASTAEKVRLFFTIREDSSLGYLQVFTNDTMLPSCASRTDSAHQQKALAMLTLFNVLRGGS